MRRRIYAIVASFGKKVWHTFLISALESLYAALVISTLFHKHFDALAQLKRAAIIRPRRKKRKKNT
jgi:uncharacterized membrane protein YraQ (UPF0718 family)